jgi:hypothetical protein
MMLVENRHGLKGRFKLRILRADRSVRHETDWIPNLITNLGMDRIGASGSFGQFCRIGTGTSAPAFTDTALQAQVASTSTNNINVSVTNAGAPNYETTATRTWEFAQGAVVGNMAELGLGWSASTANTLATRSRILDGGGSPTTITVLAGEILQVTYQLKTYPQITDSTGTVSISSVSYDYVSRLAQAASIAGLEASGAMLAIVGNVTAYTGSLGAITGTPSGTTSGLAAGSLQAYTNGTYFRDYTVTANITQGNLAGGIKSIRTVLSNSAANPATWSDTQIEFTPAIPKDGTKTLSLTFRTSWARH